ncbi:OmpA family protein [Peristeroidobacter agariperforans]|uniref:OmpA family protein n=1 Tax=Peristeroidobacter agariperforans TaxID=268404 RepID=UPI00101DF28E|nr:OmpA family protein [Peristeroidobacter agariperforans]
MGALPLVPLLTLAVIGAAHSDNATPSTSRVPLCPGLQIVTAISQANGDYESIKTVLSVDDKNVLIRYSSEQLVTDLLAADFGQVRKQTLNRSVRRSDLKSAALYQQRFMPGMPTEIAETTAIGTSQAVLRALKTAGRSEFSISNAYSGEFPANRDHSPNLYDFMSPGELVRIGQAERIPVVINGVTTSLPAIRARGEFAAEPAEFLFLDDDANPLTLKFRVGIDSEPPMDSHMKELCRTMQAAAPEISRALCGRETASDRETLEVVKIAYRCDVPVAAAEPAPAAGAQLEQQLATSGKAVVYDIHFSFNSDRIREESAPRLAEIANVLRKHSDWKLVVNGHTDSIGGDRYNLDLSRRRAAAVKQALVKSHGIAAERLTTDGFGASQPRDTNETLAGRARNRRVELIKQ